MNCTPKWCLIALKDKFTPKAPRVEYIFHKAVENEISTFQGNKKIKEKGFSPKRKT